MRAVLLVLAVGLGAPDPALCRVQSVPPSYDRAMELLHSADTAAALQALRRAVDARPDFAPALRDLGAVLGTQASELEKDVADRLEAERYLKRALDLMPRDPAALVEYGALLRKQSRAVDARRILDRALEAASEQGHALDARVLARAHLHLGKVHERWWEDWENLRWKGIPIADLKHEERDRMVGHFHRALELDPGNHEAITHLLGHLGDLGRWSEYLEEARAFTGARPDSYRAWLYLGVGLHETGRDTEASSAFQAAMDRMPESLLHPFRDVARLFPEESRERYRDAPDEDRTALREAFFRANDPLFLTNANERELEHLARVAWAQVRFSAPRSGLQGWETARGDIWIRYGRPPSRSQEGYGTGVAFGDRGSREERWSYGPNGPTFVFERSLTSRFALHSEASAVAAADLEAARPEFYRPRTVTDLHPLPLQLARFRGEIPSTVRIEIYAEPPIRGLGADPGTELETGIFVFGPDWSPLWRRTRLVEVARTPVRLDYSFEVAWGRYLYGLEARPQGDESEPRPLSRARGRVDVPGFRPGELSVSDLLLADSIGTRTDAALEGRQGLRIEPSRTLEFAPGGSVHIYFEIYGLEEGDDGLAQYSATLMVEKPEEPGLLTRVLARIPGVSGEDERQARVSWERVVEIDGDRVPDFFAFNLPEVEAGRYVASLRIRDLATGEERVVEREFEVRDGG